MKQLLLLSAVLVLSGCATVSKKDCTEYQGMPVAEADKKLHEVNGKPKFICIRNPQDTPNGQNRRYVYDGKVVVLETEKENVHKNYCD